MFRRLKFQREYNRKQREGKEQIRQHRRFLRRKYRKQRRELFRKQLRYFFSDPFKRRELNPDELLRRDIRLHARQIRRKEQKQWLDAFIRDPFRTLFIRRKDNEEIIKEQWSKVDKKIAFRNRMRNSQEAFIKIIKHRALRNRFGLTYLQSTTFFILSFLIIYIIYQLVTIGASRIFSIPIIWYYYELKFPLYTFSPLYTRKALVIIFGAGPLLCLLLGFVSLRLFFSRRIRNQNYKLFYLWGFVNGMNFFFGSYISGFITRTEFIYTSEWLFMSSMFDVEEIVFASLSITIMLIIGRLVTPLFLVSSSSVTLITPSYRPFFILCQVIIPWITGVIIFLLVTTPHYYFPLILKTITPGLFLMPTLFMYNSMYNENIHTSGVIRRTYFRWSIAIAMVALLFFYRVLLNFGLKIF